MYRYDDQLAALQSQCARKRRLEAMAAELRTQQDLFTSRARELEQQLREEQADVERLEGRSLSAFFYQLTGRMEEKLTKEKQEAYGAQLKYDTAARELAAVEQELYSCEAELEELGDCEQRYRAVMEEKARAIKAAGGGAADQILRLEERAAYLESQHRELQEAHAAGEEALSTADRIAESLRSAESWGTWDLVGGGLVTDLAKHGHLDEAQANMSTLQSQLRRFRTELADVTIDADFQVSIDGFLRVADYFFDGIFADWAVLDRIHQSQDQIENTRSQIWGVLSHLQTLLQQTAGELAQTKEAQEQLVGSVPM